WRMAAPARPGSGAGMDAAGGLAGSPAPRHDDADAGASRDDGALATVELPRAGAILGARDLAIRGEARPGTRVLVTSGGKPAREIAVRADGRFSDIVTLASGTSELVIEAVPESGR